MITRKITQLEAELTRQEAETEARVDLLNELAWELWTTDRSRASELTQESIRLAKQLAYPRGIAFSRLNRGMMEWSNDIEGSVTYILNALEWFEAHGEKEGEANARGILGILYWSFGDYQRGFELANQATNLYQAIGDQDGMAWADNILGGFYYDRKDYRRSLTHYEAGYRLFKKIGDPLGEGRALIGIGNAYHFMGDYDQALDYQQQSLKTLTQIHHDMSISRTLNDIGLIYQSLGDLEQALDYHQQSLAIRETLNYGPGLTTTLMDVGRVYIRQHRLKEAREMYQKALTLSEELRAKPKISKALEGLAEIAELLEDYHSALGYFKRLHEITVEVYSEDGDSKLKNIKAAYEVEASKREAEIYRLKNVELKAKNDDLQQTIKKLNATQAQIIQSGKMVALGQLVAGIAHEINTPIGAIKSGNDVSARIATKLLNSLKSDSAMINLEKELQKSLGILQQSSRNNARAAERIVGIIRSLKNFSRLDEADFQEADIHEGLESTLTLISHEIKDKITVEKDYGELPRLYLYVNEINQVFMNLLLNAVQASYDGGKIRLKTFRENGQICVRIADTGKGIPREKLENLFEPGFSTDSARVKMRTGLYTSYSIIQKHKGDIQVESEVGKGTAFTICLPVNLNDHSKRGA